MSRTEGRNAPVDMSPQEFRELGHRMVDRIAGHLETLSEQRVSPGLTPPQARNLVGSASLPQTGMAAGPLLEETADLLLNHSLFSGHPRFWGYVIGAATPLSALGDLLSAGVNPNLGGWILAPVACEIEAQTVRWIAEMLDYPVSCGGLLVSGGNMANFVGLWTGRRVKAQGEIRKQGIAGEGTMRIYTSRETHTWIEKAADLTGLGTDCIRWIPTDPGSRMDMGALRRQVESDRAAGDRPLMVVATAGTVSTGSVDPLIAIHDLCREHDLWFHVDGAYGGPAAMLPGAPADLKALNLADSVAIDPHKWMYAAVEAGCVLVRSPRDLLETFSYRPPYYPERDTGEDPGIMYYEYGPQNSRGFRALKVWLNLRHVGREGYEKMISDDIELAGEAYRLIEATPGLEAFTQGLSVTTFRFVPEDLEGREAAESYLDDLNRELHRALQDGGELFLSNAVLGDTYVLRICIVNFRTARQDIGALPEIILRQGRKLDEAMRPAALRARTGR